MNSPRQKQSGVMLLEALIGILLFSIGILGMVSMQAASIKAGSDSNYRSEASYLANQIIGQMWTDQTNLPSYSLNAGAVTCAKGSSASNNQTVTSWLNDASRLPGSNSLQQQIVIDPATNQVTVTVCWLPPNTKTAHNFVASSSIN